MNRSNLIFLLIGTAMIFFSCSGDNPMAPKSNQGDPMMAAKFNPTDLVTTSLAKKPSPNLVGTTNTPFTFTPPTFWNGTIDFGGVIYGLTFISYDAPRDYSQASPFEEDFIIYEFGTDWTIPANVYLTGWDNGVVTKANRPPDPCKFVANGEVEIANSPFEMWLGRKVHISGIVYWHPTSGLPDYATSTFRIN
jgi:hypothetical protein